jgi:hypothetical protein
MINFTNGWMWIWTVVGVLAVTLKSEARYRIKLQNPHDISKEERES